VVEVVAERPGTKVSIRHAQIALVQDEAGTASPPPATASPDAGAIGGWRSEERS